VRLDLYRAVLLGAALLAVAYLFYSLLPLLLLGLATIIIALPLKQAADWSERRNLPRSIGAIGAILIGFTFLTSVGFWLVPALASQIDTFIQRIPIISSHLEALALDRLRLDLDFQKYFNSISKDDRWLGNLVSLSLSVSEILITLLLMLVIAFYTAVNPRPLVQATLRLFALERRYHVYKVILRIRKMWVAWLEGLFLDMLIVGGSLWFALWMVDLKFALVFAVLAALLTAVPYFGAIVAGFPPVLFALLESPSKALLVLGIYVTIQQIESHIIIPSIMARRMQLHPAAIALGAVIVGQLFGIAGLFLAVPIVALVIILVEEFYIKPLELNGRGVLSEREHKLSESSSDMKN
jgi:predicted PurR-regulated permease PerM